MKIKLALATAVILLMVMAPIALAADSGTTVYVSVSVDGELLVAAQPITVTDTTVDAVIKAAHNEFYSDGESGYTAGIDPTWNMYLISKCWGVVATPFIIINDAPLGATAPQTVDTTTVAANDNIIICTSSDPMNNPAQPVALTSTLSGDSATVTATSWTLDFMTFMYSSAPLANADVIDPATDASLGKTDADGRITVTVPESGVIAVAGLAAINVKNPPVSAPAAPAPISTPSTPAGPVTVYVSVSVDDELLVAAQPITVTDMTVDAVIKAAHSEFYSGGESGYTADIDPTWNMVLVTQCWGVQATPFVIVNDKPLGADPAAPATVDVAPVAPNDNIIICTSSDPMNNPAQPVSLMSTLSGDSATVTVTSWTLDFMTFMYSSTPFANANVIDPTTGASLGITDADGSITVTVPESGVVAIEGLAAINVKNPPTLAPAATTTTPAGGAIPYTDAKQYIGQTVTIQAQVFEKTDAGEFWVLYLGGPSTDPNAVGIEVAKSDVSKFPADLYVGKTITITGELHTNPVGGASFSLTDPSQVQEGGVSSPGTPAPAPATPESTGTPIFYGPTINLMIWAVIILTPVLVIIIVKMVRQSRLDKETAHIATAVSPSAALGSTPAGPAFGPVPSGPAPASAPPISTSAPPPPPISTPGPPTPKPTAAATAPAPAAPSGSEATVYVSVSVDGKLLVAAQPVTVTDTTVQGVIRAAHEEFYSGGISGYTAGIDPTFNMFLVTRCWGIQATPYVILNDRPLGADPNVPPTVDAAPVADNDNIIICTSSDPMNKPAQPVSLTAFVSGDSATLTAKAWTLDFTTFTYSSTSLNKSKVIDPVTGASLGKTDAHGRITVTVPESGIVAIDGLAAMTVTPKKKQ